MECSNCSQLFRESNPPKLLIQCGHTICQKCLQKLYFLFKVVCPECKQESLISDISMVPTNQALLNLNLGSRESLSISNELCFPTFKKVRSTEESPHSSSQISEKCRIHSKNIEAVCIENYEGLCIDCILSDAFKNKEILAIDKVKKFILKGNSMNNIFLGS